MKQFPTLFDNFRSFPKLTIEPRQKRHRSNAFAYKFGFVSPRFEPSIAPWVLCIILEDGKHTVINYIESMKNTRA